MAKLLIYNKLEKTKGVFNMINRFLEKEVELSLNDTLVGYNSPIRLEYYFLESEITDMDELSGLRTYGVEIVKKVDGFDNEIKTIKNLSCCKECVKNILGKLVEHTVTPVSLRYILDDMLGA